MRFLALALVLLFAGCQPASKGGGKSTGGYNPERQPATTHDTGPGAAAQSGRVPREAGGRNAGAYGTPPEGGPRGAGSEVTPPNPDIRRRHTVSTPSPRP